MQQVEDNNKKQTKIAKRQIIQSRMLASRIEKNKVDNGSRKILRGILNRQQVSQHPKLLMITVFTLSIILGHRMPSFRPVELSRPYLDVFSIFVGSLTVDITMIKRIYASIMIISIMCCEIYLHLGVHQGIVRLKQSLLQLLLLRALLHRQLMDETLNMNFLLIRNLRHPLLSSLVC